MAAIAGVVLAAACVVQCGTTVAAVSGGPVVIGETTKRVTDFAGSNGLDYMRQQLPNATQAVKQLAGFTWFNRMMDQGRPVADFGREPEKVKRGLDIGSYYLQELQQAADRGYPLIHR